MFAPATDLETNEKKIRREGGKEIDRQRQREADTGKRGGKGGEARKRSTTVKYLYGYRLVARYTGGKGVVVNEGYTFSVLPLTLLGCYNTRVFPSFVPASLTLFQKLCKRGRTPNYSHCTQVKKEKNKKITSRSPKVPRQDADIEQVWTVKIGVSKER